MNKYILPEGFDFESALGSIEDSADETDVCLITQEPLSRPFVTLSCGHKFNYAAIYYEVLQQKKTRSEGGNVLETTRLLSHQMKCPYCRHIENNILPYFPGLGIPKTRLVNSPNRWSLQNDKCKAIIKSGKRRGIECGNPCHGDLCVIHIQSKKKDVKKCQAVLSRGPRKGQTCGCSAQSIKFNDGSEKFYCKRHAKIQEKET